MMSEVNDVRSEALKMMSEVNGVKSKALKMVSEVNGVRSKAFKMASEVHVSDAQSSNYITIRSIVEINKKAIAIKVMKLPNCDLVINF